MTINAQSLALLENGTLFLQDGLSNETADQYIDYDLWNTCDQGIQFHGGTESVSRHSIVSNTDVSFLYQVNNPVSKVAVYPEDTWKDNLRKSFTTERYPPHVVVHDVIPITKEYHV
jgi:hypothetical protein